MFILVAAGTGLAVAGIVRETSADPDSFFASDFNMVLIAVALGIGGIVLDVMFSKRSPATLGAIFVGLIVGGLLAFFAASAISLLFPNPGEQNYANAVKLISWVVLTYFAISVLLQTKDNFRFIIPYVEFRRETRGEKPIILDTSAVIDGRISDLVETQFIQDPLVVPSFVLAELQAVADSSVRTRRVRGRRGLDVLSKLRENGKAEVKVFEAADSDEPVDQRLVKLARTLDGRILTTDYNLNKVAQVQGVPVINLNDIANALKPVFVPGEMLTVNVIKPGEGNDQGVGYLDDGTMVVVEDGRSRIGKPVTIAVTSVLQTSAGRMVFGRPESP
jgi:uncharacterized protein YacL